MPGVFRREALKALAAAATAASGLLPPLGRAASETRASTETGAPIYLVSVGPRRAETIVLHNPFVGRAAAP